MVSAVFFDFGGVIGIPTWTLDDFFRVSKSVLGKHGIHVPEDFKNIFLEIQRDYLRRSYTTLRETPFEIILSEALEKVGIRRKPEELLDIIVDISSHTFHRLNDSVVYVLEKLKEMGLKIGLISNTRLFIPKIFLKNKGIDKYFDVIVLSRDVGYMKPHPKIFEEALKLANVLPNESVYVGDVLEIDVYGAKRVGMIAVLYGEPEPVYSLAGIDLRDLMKEQVEPDFRILDLRELLDILMNLKS